ncbi:MAG: nitroreductase [Methylibium petroleiphilum]|nr:nitroreductase [Methylibium petroleiphilum]
MDLVPLQHGSGATLRVPASLAGVSTFTGARALMAGRQNVSPKRLVDPGPSPQQIDDMLTMAGTAPDHGQLTPWRFVIVPIDKRTLLAEVFALALIDRDPGATLEQIEAAREKAHRAPVLMLAVARLGAADPDIPPFERVVSLGAAIQNLLLSAHALGFGAGLTSGQAMASPRMRALFGLAEGEVPVCFVNVGTIAKAKPPRLRPRADTFTSTL